LAILLERNVDDGEAASFLWKPLEICLDEYLDGFFARVNLDANRRERRGAEAHVDRLPRFVEELVASKVDIIVTFGYPPAIAAKQRTALPVVSFAAGDPVGTGLVDSLARPGGNLTGISDVSAEVTPKRLELLKEIAPGLRRVAMLWNAADLGMALRYRASEAGAKTMGVGVQQLGVREPDDFDQAFVKWGVRVVRQVVTLPSAKPLRALPLHKLQLLADLTGV